MITAKDAFRKVRKKTEPDAVPVACREYKDYYGFLIGPPGSKNGGKVFTGGLIYFISKETNAFFTSEDPQYKKNVLGKPWRSITVNA